MSIDPCIIKNDFRVILQYLSKLNPNILSITFTFQNPPCFALQDSEFFVVLILHRFVFSSISHLIVSPASLSTYSYRLGI